MNNPVHGLRLTLLLSPAEIAALDRFKSQFNLRGREDALHLMLAIVSRAQINISLDPPGKL